MHLIFPAPIYIFQLLRLSLIICYTLDLLLLIYIDSPLINEQVRQSNEKLIETIQILDFPIPESEVARIRVERGKNKDLLN